MKVIRKVMQTIVSLLSPSSAELIQWIGVNVSEVDIGVALVLAVIGSPCITVCPNDHDMAFDFSYLSALFCRINYFSFSIICFICDSHKIFCFTDKLAFDQKLSLVCNTDEWTAEKRRNGCRAHHWSSLALLIVLSCL